MKAPGIPAKKKGTKLRRGRAVQVMTYPRARTKQILVQASRDVNRSLSSFMILASLRAVAALRSCDIADLLPSDELKQYQNSRISNKRRVLEETPSFFA